MYFNNHRMVLFRKQPVGQDVPLLGLCLAGVAMVEFGFIRTGVWGLPAPAGRGQSPRLASLKAA